MKITLLMTGDNSCSLSIDENPMDKTGVRCSHRQDLTNLSEFHLSGISGGTAEIECNIPAGWDCLLIESL